MSFLWSLKTPQNNLWSVKLLLNSSIGLVTIVDYSIEVTL
jgi:hypothetical protein